ncbi:MAG: hypothetical protein NC485_02115 [Ruminococcus flavefaciens]|nr:hypothetical protein [Ruminococcus flavefaciens]MCM1059962.1 hypothetical protein [Eubacterium sp.]
MEKQINYSRKIISVISMLFPLLYTLMYLPIWNGNNLEIYNNFTLVLFIIQVIAFALAAINSYNIIFKRRLLHQSTFIVSMIISVLLLGFVCIFFVENLMGIPPIPPQQ